MPVFFPGEVRGQVLFESLKRPRVNDIKSGGQEFEVIPPVLGFFHDAGLSEEDFYFFGKAKAKGPMGKAWPFLQKM